MKTERTKPKVSVQPRQEGLDYKLIDLSEFYNISLNETVHDKPGNDLSDLGAGVHTFGGTEYDIRGIIQLSSSISEEKTKVKYPSKIEGIAINQKAKAISFVQSSAWDSEKGTIAAFYIINFVDRTKEKISLQYQIQMEDWWAMPESVVPDEAEIVWKGQNQRTLDLNFHLQLYKYTWINPFHEKEIKTLDIISNNERTGLMLFAITIE